MFDTAVQSATEDTASVLNGISAAEIRGELDRVLSSRVFVHSHRIRRFLQFVVEECLLGQHHRLKEYLIGLEVFNRRDAFDPRVDSIVRVEARRLRAKLEEYYLTEGREDELRIVLRKGSYVPAFEYRQSGTAGVGAVSAHSQRRAIAVAPFSISNGGGEHSAFVDEVKRRLTHVLIKEGMFQVLPYAPQQAGVSEQAATEPEMAGTPGQEESLRTPFANSNGGNQNRQLPKPDYVIEGSVEIHGSQVHVIVQLLNVIDTSYVWSQDTDCTTEDLSPIDALARALNAELLTPHPTGARAKLHGGKKQSYDYYLQGRYSWKSGTPEGVRNSITNFRQALDIDPEYGAAWAALAEAYLVSAMFGFVDPSESDRIREAAQLAVKLNPDLPEAHIALGAVLSLMEWDWEAGENEFQRAIQLDGHDPTTHVAYGVQLACRGMHEAAIAELERALELDPASLFPNFVLGWLCGLCGRIDESLAQHRLVAQLAPDFALSYLGLGWAHCVNRMFSDAIAHFTNATHLLKCRSLLRGCLGYCYAMSGRREEALRELSALNSQAQTQYTSPISFAAIYAGLGDKERALSYLEQALQNRDSALPLYLMNPEFQSLRDEPRFMNLREKIGLGSPMASA